jgi:large subunit ribosomal protein L22
VTTFQGRDEQARIPTDVARRVLRHVTGMRVPDALHALRFTLSMACPEVARVVQIAAAEAAHRGAHTPENLVVVAGIVRDGADMVRLRRQAHGIAGWITTTTTDVTVEVALESQRAAMCR